MCIRDRLQKELDYPMAIGMRYGNPSIEAGFQSLLEQAPDLDEVFMIPLYPHYAMATTRTVVEEAERVISHHKWSFKLSIQDPFYEDPDYIKILAESIAPYVKKDFDHLLFSYHGVPVRHLKKQDPTKSHCYKMHNF